MSSTSVCWCTHCKDILLPFWSKILKRKNLVAVTYNMRTQTSKHRRAIHADLKKPRSHYYLYSHQRRKESRFLWMKIHVACYVAAGIAWHKLIICHQTSLETPNPIRSYGEINQTWVSALLHCQRTLVLLTFYYMYCSIISTVWEIFPQFSVISTVQSPPNIFIAWKIKNMVKKIGLTFISTVLIIEC